MEANNRDESIEFGSKGEGLPNSPAETNSKVLLMASLLKQVDQIHKCLPHLPLVQALSIWDYLREISGVISIDFREYFRQVDIVAPFGIGVCDALVSSREGPKDIREDDEDSLTLANMVNFDPIEVKGFSFRLILNIESRPGAWRAASMLVLSHERSYEMNDKDKQIQYCFLKQLLNTSCKSSQKQADRFLVKPIIKIEIANTLQYQE